MRGLGVSSQGEAFTPLDRQGRILGQAMVSSDSRAAGNHRARLPRHSAAKGCIVSPGHTAHPMFTLFKLLVVARQPARRMASKLTGSSASRICSTSAWAWSPPSPGPSPGAPCCSTCAPIAWNADILSQRESTRGSWLAPAAFRLDCRHHTGQASGGPGAGPRGHRGHGGPRPALRRPRIWRDHQRAAPCGPQALWIALRPSFAEPVLSDELYRSNLCTYDHAMPGMYTTVAFNLTGGNLLRWFRDEWGQVEVGRGRAHGRQRLRALAAPDARAAIEPAGPAPL